MTGRRWPALTGHVVCTRARRLPSSSTCSRQRPALPHKNVEIIYTHIIYTCHIHSKYTAQTYKRAGRAPPVSCPLERRDIAAALLLPAVPPPRMR